MKKKIIITSIILLIGLVAYPKNKKNMALKAKLHPLTDNQTIRGCDLKGCGSFGANRGDRKHEGIDIIVHKGQQIKSPISGTVTRKSYPYANDLKYEGLLIENDTHSVFIWYMYPWKVKGQQINKGDIIGVAQDISEKYGSGMQPHVHFQIEQNGIAIDPTNLF